MATELAPAARIPWAQHRAWLDHNWAAGMHVSVVVATGGGKSHLVRHGLLPLWEDYRVLLFDVKGDDPTLGGWGQVVHGYPEQEERQPQDDRQRLYRLVVPEWEFDPHRRSTGGLDRARREAGGALDRAYKAGRWVLDLDEARAFTDNVSEFGLGLRGVVENIWVRGRSREVTLVACTQQPVWMPSSFYSQPALIYIGAEVDLANDHLRDIGGDRDQLRRAVAQLQQFEFVAVYRRPPRQLWIVKAPG